MVQILILVGIAILIIAIFIVIMEINRHLKKIDRINAGEVYRKSIADENKFNKR